MTIRHSLQVYFIMGSNNCIDNPLYVLEQALAGGITMFQFREKGRGAKTGTDKQKLALQMKELCRRYHVPFLVNDDVDLAIKVGADGIHVGQEDEPIDSVRRRCPEHFIVGVSATNVHEAVEADSAGADYIGAGPVFATATKHDAKTPIGLEGLAEIRRLIGNTPLVAIGGIQEKNAAEVIKAGADGISVISAISASENALTAAQQLKLRTIVN
ncbi:thiamine phosphate synthase [Sediminibacillus halophilus]|uniref:Thiamine-phosphate synthase n=1 Tax=Sediminibacillus halophilus TaxID=482461 RepID=A0A1G9X088_9BACI|nr:thiamine phosphate synthase [Sediminibacillus halophilus]SDM89911.1 thiamine-phosphate pyrophosphorylase [Sediminibacillus halophilus]